MTISRSKNIHKGLLFIVILQSKSRILLIDIDFIIGYSTVKIERLSDWYWFYYNFREIEQQKVHHQLLYIKCVSVVWEHVVLTHGASTAFIRESLRIFFVYFCLYSFYVFPFMKSINISLFGSTLCQLREQLRP